MKVQDTQHVAHPPHSFSTTRSARQEGKQSTPQADRSRDAVDPIETEAVLTTDKTRGVVRLLENGHFKGVADVRLRINFFDELSSRNHASAAAKVSGQTEILSSSIAATIEESIAGLPLDAIVMDEIEKLVTDLESGLQEASDAFKSQDDATADSLISAFESQIESLLTGLTDLIVPPSENGTDATDSVGAPGLTPDATNVAPQSALTGSADLARDTAPNLVTDELEPGTDQDGTGPTNDIGETGDAGPVSVADTPPEPIASDSPVQDSPDSVDSTFDDGTDSADLYSAVLATIRETADRALAEFETSFTNTLKLDEPSDPNGRGSAYARFLALYHALLSPSSTVNEEA